MSSWLERVDVINVGKRTYVCTQPENVGALRNMKSVPCYSERSIRKFGLDET